MQHHSSFAFSYNDLQYCIAAPYVTICIKAVGCLQNKNNPEGHEGPARRFVQFGGGISADQLDWLKQQLADAKTADQHVIVCGHLPLHPDTCIGTCLLWNYEEVLQAIWDAGNVVTTITGHAHNVSLNLVSAVKMLYDARALCASSVITLHALLHMHGRQSMPCSITICRFTLHLHANTCEMLCHILYSSHTRWTTCVCDDQRLELSHTVQDGYKLDEHGVHHRVLNAVLEAEPGKDCYGWIDAYSDRLELVGVGELQSQQMPFGKGAVSVPGPKAQPDNTVQAEDATLDRQP